MRTSLPTNFTPYEGLSRTVHYPSPADSNASRTRYVRSTVLSGAPPKPYATLTGTTERLPLQQTVDRKYVCTTCFSKQFACITQCKAERFRTQPFGVLPKGRIMMDKTAYNNIATISTSSLQIFGIAPNQDGYFAWQLCDFSGYSQILPKVACVHPAGGELYRRQDLLPHSMSTTYPRPCVPCFQCKYYSSDNTLQFFANQDRYTQPPEIDGISTQA